MGAAEQLHVLVGDGEVTGVPDHVEQRAGVGQLLAPAEPQA
jgi:hypothetical protein